MTFSTSQVTRRCSASPPAPTPPMPSPPIRALRGLPPRACAPASCATRRSRRSNPWGNAARGMGIWPTLSSVVPAERAGRPPVYTEAAMSRPPDNYPLLCAIESPADLRRLPAPKLPALAAELREFLIHSVSTRGGHFAAGLGTVELTIALHYVFDTPRDRLVWDVGHQAYPHKVLTGRRDKLHTIKQDMGLAPFPTRSESEYDTSGGGHYSNSTSAALGMAVAAARTGEGRRGGGGMGRGATTAGRGVDG